MVLGVQGEKTSKAPRKANLRAAGATDGRVDGDHSERFLGRTSADEGL